MAMLILPLKLYSVAVHHAIQRSVAVYMFLQQAKLNNAGCDKSKFSDSVTVIGKISLQK